MSHKVLRLVLTLLGDVTSFLNFYFVDRGGDDPVGNNLGFNLPTVNYVVSSTMDELVLRLI